VVLKVGWAPPEDISPMAAFLALDAAAVVIGVAGCAAHQLAITRYSFKHSR